MYGITLEVLASDEECKVVDRPGSVEEVRKKAKGKKREAVVVDTMMNDFSASAIRHQNKQADWPHLCFQDHHLHLFHRDTARPGLAGLHKISGASNVQFYNGVYWSVDRLRLFSSIRRFAVVHPRSGVYFCSNS